MPLTVEHEALTSYIEAGPTAVPRSESIEEVVAPVIVEAAAAITETTTITAVPAAETQQPLRVFITHGKNLALVTQVETMLQVSETDYEIAIKEESTAITVPERVFGAMRRCSAGIIIVSKEQVQGESAIVQINPNVLIEIGAAFVLYDRRVVLVWEKGMTVPSNLQGLYRYEFEGNELGFASGMKQMKAIKEFRKQGSEQLLASSDRGDVKLQPTAGLGHPATPARLPPDHSHRTPTRIVEMATMACAQPAGVPGASHFPQDARAIPPSPRSPRRSIGTNIDDDRVHISKRRLGAALGSAKYIGDIYRRRKRL